MTMVTACSSMQPPTFGASLPLSKIGLEASWAGGEDKPPRVQAGLLGEGPPGLPAFSPCAGQDGGSPGLGQPAPS